MIRIHAVRHGVLLKIYDELVQSVEGYSVGGQQLTGRGGDPAGDGRVAQSEGGGAAVYGRGGSGGRDEGGLAHRQTKPGFVGDP